MRNFLIFATYYFLVSLKEQKQSCVGVQPTARAGLISARLSPFLHFFVPLSLLPPCPLLIILG